MNSNDKEKRVLLITAIFGFLLLSIIITVLLFSIFRNKDNKKSAFKEQQDIIREKSSYKDGLVEKPKKYKINKETGLPDLGVHPEKQLKDMDDGEYDVFEANIINKLNNYDFISAIDYIEKTYEKIDMSTNQEYLKNEKFYLDVVTLSFLYGLHGTNSNEVVDFLKNKAVDERAIFFANMQMNYDKWTVKSSDAYVPATEDRVNFLNIRDVTNQVNGSLLREIKKYAPNYNKIILIEFKDDNSSYSAYFTKSGDKTEFITIKTDDNRKKTVSQWNEKFKELENIKKNTTPTLKTTNESELIDLEATNLREKLNRSIDSQDMAEHQKNMKKKEIEKLTDDRLQELKDEFDNRKDVN